MHLCFGSFARTLLDSRKNNALTEVLVGRELLGFIDPDYIVNRDDRYFYYFTSQERELPRSLKNKLTDVPALCKQFALFIEKYLSPDHELIRQGFVRIIQDDGTLLDNVRNHLLEISKQLELPAFLAELFVFAVDSASNRTDGAKPRVSRKRFNLQKEIKTAIDNEVLYGLLQIAVEEREATSLASCFAKMTNNVYIARALVFLSRDQNFGDHPEYRDLFHTVFSGMENNKYRHEVFAGCLETGYFRAHPEQLLEPHLREYTNNRYTYDSLILLCELGMSEYAERYRRLLTNKTYAKRLSLYLTEHA